MNLKFTLPFTLPGTNEITRKDRSAHWHVGAKLRKKAVADCAKALGAIVNFMPPVAIEFEWFEPNAKRDPDNIIAGQKFILDALVGRGFLPNDSQKEIRSLSHRVHVDAARPRVEVTVYEISV